MIANTVSLWKFEIGKFEFLRNSKWLFVNKFRSIPSHCILMHLHRLKFMQSIDYGIVKWPTKIESSSLTEIFSWFICSLIATQNKMIQKLRFEVAPNLSQTYFNSWFQYKPFFLCKTGNEKEQCDKIKRNQENQSSPTCT